MLTGPFHRETLPAGFAGTARTIDAMRALACGPFGARSPRLRALALSAIRAAGVKERDYLGEVRALHAWVMGNIRYVRDPIGQELLTAPEALAFDVKAGDCDDHAMLEAAMLMAMGCRTRFVTIGWDASRPDEFGHVYLEAKAPGQAEWLPLDPIAKNKPPGWDAPAPVRRVWPENQTDPEGSRPMAGTPKKPWNPARGLLRTLRRTAAKAATLRQPAPVRDLAAGPWTPARPLARLAIDAAAKSAEMQATARNPGLSSDDLSSDDLSDLGRRRGGFKRIAKAVKRIAPIALAPATGGASLLATKKGRKVFKRVGRMVSKPKPAVDPEAEARAREAADDQAAAAELAATVQGLATVQAEASAQASMLRQAEEAAAAAAAEAAPAEEAPAEASE